MTLASRTCTTCTVLLTEGVSARTFHVPEYNCNDLGKGAMKDPAELKKCLDRLTAIYDRRYLDTDPLGLVHRYSDPADIEVAGLIAASLSYGGAGIIRSSVTDVLKRCGQSPSRFVRELSPDAARNVFAGFKHRWTTGGHVGWLCLAIGGAVNEYGSLGAMVMALDDTAEKDTGGVMSRFSDNIVSRVPQNEWMGGSRIASLSYLVPSPDRGSAAKRLAMYFRWMVRGPDGLDFGLWSFIGPSRLVIPVDRHIGRMGRLLGLTRRTVSDWRMALEITESLRCLDPDDPVRYDFALVRPGITGECTHVKPGDCNSCIIRDFCGDAHNRS